MLDTGPFLPVWGPDTCRPADPASHSPFIFPLLPFPPLLFHPSLPSLSFPYVLSLSVTSLPLHSPLLPPLFALEAFFCDDAL